tara:strand:- start:191 stop:784 length:594 start_codon:yes stop_codon:yes gene_type:complete
MHCRERGLIHIHIHKTAGKSIEETIWNRGGSMGQSCHRNFREYERKPRFNTKGIFFFSFVRNPWDRAVSSFHALNEVYKTFSGIDKNFKEAVMEGHLRIKTPTQYDFLKDRNGNLSKINFIGRFENINEDWKKCVEGINEHMKSNPRIDRKHYIKYEPLMHINKSKHKHYSEYYDAETRDEIAKIYADDIEKFNYDF